MVNKSDLTIGKKIWIASPTCGICDGMVAFEIEVRTFSDNSVNYGIPFSYCFLNKDDAKAFVEQEDEKGYAAFDIYYKEVQRVKGLDGIIIL